MRKVIGVFIISLMLVTSCSSQGQHIAIDWVDFVKWDGVMYDGIYTGALADETFIDKKLGEVQFKVADNVEDPAYKVKNGDAAFHEKGTKIYSVKGYSHIIAVKSPEDIHHYRLYYSRDHMKNKWHFQDVKLEDVNRIEIYQAYTLEGNKLLKNINNPEQVSHFLGLLKGSENSPNFEPNTKNGDPKYYKMVLYTADPVAYMFDLQYDGFTYYWFPSDPAVLSDEIQQFIN